MLPMKILLLGAQGQLGHELLALLSARGETTALSRADVDVADLGALGAAVARAHPDLIVNASAYNEVDRAESEPAAALRVNAEAVAFLGEYALRERRALIHYSTDFVFDGTKTAPYVETDPPNPLSAYGRSKLAGERALAEMGAPAIVLRTAWVYSLRRKSFVSMMLKLAREKKELKVATDQVGSPTWCRDLARVTVGVVDRLGTDPFARVSQARGVYHAAGGGACSRHELATAAVALDPRKEEHVVERILKARAAEFPAPAARPAHAPLDCGKLRAEFGVSFLPWKEALAEALAGPG
jgi:dTDP-4-dehydrorhamnose reductase